MFPQTIILHYHQSFTLVLFFTMPIHMHYICRVWQNSDIDTESINQLPQPNMVTIQLRTRKISLYAQEGSSTTPTSFSPIRQPTSVKSFTVPRFSVQFKDTMQTFISLILTIAGVPEAHQGPMAQKFCALARSVSTSEEAHTLLPIVVSVVIVRILSSYDETEAIMRAVSESMEMLKLVPATKSAIEGLEKVRVRGSGGSMEQCMVCLEDFSVGLEVASLPCQHVFHGDCIVHWLETSHSCPLCRFPMPC